MEDKTEKSLTLEEYQKRAMKTCTESSNNFEYMMLNLVGEVGELAGKIAKMIRKGNAVVNNNTLDFIGNITIAEFNDLYHQMYMEAGDVLWQLSGLCTAMGWSLEDVGRDNLKKLADRQKRNVIVGEGDER